MQTDNSRPIILNFAATDSAGLAGLSTDIKTQHALGAHAVSVVTAITAQNNKQVSNIDATADESFLKQLKAVEHLPIKAIKTGVLLNTLQIETITAFAKKTALPFIIDPVIQSTSGQTFLENAVELYEKYLLPAADLITPNIPEAALLSGHQISTRNDMLIAAVRLLDMGAKAVIIKGGHLVSEDNQTSIDDLFASEKKSFWLASPAISTNNTRGTGCAFASTLAACAALGYSIYDAAVIAKMAINQGLRNSYPLSNSSNEKGTLNIRHLPNASEDMPTLIDVSLNTHTTPNKLATFITNQTENFPLIWPKLGLYPIVDRAEWIETLAPAGIQTIQLRIKDLSGDALAHEIEKGVILAAKHNCRLFVNDHWQFAIKFQAHGVHLGQEDLADADLDRIHGSGLRLGISTHCHYEVARALALKPSYIACGPIYETTSKDMPWIPQGLNGLNYWLEMLDIPIVAIGGINQERFAAIAKTKVNGIAMISGITAADDPLAAAKHFQTLL